MPRYAFFWIALLTLPVIVGCDGCTPTASTNPNGEEDEKAPREAYSTHSAIAFPADQSATFGAVKPGHWVTAEQSIRSNKANTRGELISHASVVLRDANLETTGSIDSYETVRPVVLPKGQMRGFDFRFRCPVPNSIETRRINLFSRLIPRSGGILDTGGQPFTVMRGSEYFFVVLTTRPDQFTRLQIADWTRGAESSLDGPVADVNYRVLVPDVSGFLPLPETMLDLTSTAVIFWDDLSEDALTPLQQSALADWVRFGGRLIINGASASESVANTSLADLLPLVPTSNIELDGDAAVSLLTHWSVKTDRSLKKQIEVVRSESSRIAIDGQLGTGAVDIANTGSLVLTRQIGRGNVVQPRFDLTSDWVVGWDSYDSFFNCVILNRPPREYVAPRFDEAEDTEYGTGNLSLFFLGTKSRSDAAVNSQFRIASRDSLIALPVAPSSDHDQPSQSMGNATRNASAFDPFSRVNAITGLSAWNDNSDMIMLMRQTLTSEAGIEIPDSSLVVRSLAIYLVVLVPLNYIIFRLMNRLEYAWFAVPIIAVIGAVWAAREARLDIGFARSNTELAILEAHADYPRAHLTRLIGVYNSLSSRYVLQFRTVDGVALPLDNEPDPNTSVVPSTRVSYEEGPALADFAVQSNRMRFVHTEEMIDLGGAFAFDGDKTLTSESTIDLLDAIMIRKDVDGTTEVGFIGGLNAGESKTVELRETERLLVPTGLPMQTSRLIRRLGSPSSIPNGSTRLIARIDGPLQGLDITPKASQYVGQTIAIIHLQHPKMPKPVADKNLVSDFRRVNRIDILDKEKKTDPTSETPVEAESEESAAETTAE